MLYSLPSTITARSPSASFFGGSVDGLHLHDLLLGELLEDSSQPRSRGDLEGRGHDRAAVARMRLDDLADPFRIEQIGEALRRVLRLHQLGVVGDDAERRRGSWRTCRPGPCARRDSAWRRPPARYGARMPSRFQTMKCAASDELTTSTRVDVAARIPGRCAGTRARRRCARPAPRCRDISPRTPWRSSRPAAGRPRCTRRPCLPSCAASISSGVIARRRRRRAQDAACETAVDARARSNPCSTSRRENVRRLIVVSSR